MPQYYYKKNHIKSQKRWSRAKKLFFGIVLVILLLGVGGGVYIWQSDQGSSDKPTVLQPLTHGYYSGSPKRVVENDRFKFQSSNVWQFSREESPSSSRYVFFKQNNNLIEYELDILFDKSANNKPVNYLMPVTLENGKMKAGPVSDRCGNKIVAGSKGKTPAGTATLQYMGVTYICDVLGSRETAAAGIASGGYNIPLKTSKGETVVLNFLFTNNTSGAFEQTFKEVLESFQLK